MKKKNYDYIAAVEKSIADKYGKTAVQDFRSQWTPEQEKEYLKQLSDARRSADKRESPRTNPNRTCSLCKTYSFSGRDDLYMNRFKCCYFCYVDFVHQNPKAWEKGKRPTQDDMDMILRRRKYGHGTRNN